ncbi:hypothetical protein RB195_023371 [Necator americanus]|uniref:Uncharacterized protein n=1 Tax=Necator americanus TaxID=51031 RepID=A0ABR1EIW0_NECAM
MAASPILAMQPSVCHDEDLYAGMDVETGPAENIWKLNLIVPLEQIVYGANTMARKLRKLVATRSDYIWPKPAAMEFERWCDIFEKFVKWLQQALSFKVTVKPPHPQQDSSVVRALNTVLSPYNTVLVNINQEFLSTAECIGREDICCQYADVVLAAYRRYLPAGHPELSQRLRSAFLSKVQHHPLQQCRMLLLEAYNNAVLSHGENHPIATELASYLS